MNNFILITGNPVDGFLYIGPFADYDDAQDYAETHIKNEPWWIHLLDEPAI